MSSKLIVDEIENSSGGKPLIVGSTFQEDTLATLRARTTTPDTVWVSGYHTKDDGAFGSNIFRWNSTSTEDDNSGTIIKLDGVATGRYELQYDGAINVKWFGARGSDTITDGTHYDYNDAPSIQAAIDFANSKQSETIGASVYIPAGKYPIKEPIYTTIGLKLIGDGATGLVSIDPSPSSGAVLLLSLYKDDDTAWTDTVLQSGDVTIPYQVMFIHQQGTADFEDFGAITQGNDTTKSIFCLAGLDKNPYDDNGFSQGYFKRLRLAAFNTCFYGSRMEDVYFDSCGFEYNIYDFRVTSGYDTLNTEKQGVFGGMHFNNCVFFGAYSNFIAFTGTSFGGTFSNLSFTGCSFSAPDSPSHLSFFQASGAYAELSKLMFSSCSFGASGSNSQDRVLYAEGSNPTIENLLFSGCYFDDVKWSFGYTAPTATISGLNINGCLLKDTPISVDYELSYHNISNNNFEGASYIELQGSYKGVINGNNFFNTSHSKTYDINFDSDGSSDFVVVGNLLTTKGLAKHSSSSRYKILSNLNVTDASNP